MGLLYCFLNLSPKCHQPPRNDDIALKVDCAIVIYTLFEKAYTEHAVFVIDGHFALDNICRFCERQRK